MTKRAAEAAEAAESARLISAGETSSFPHSKGFLYVFLSAYKQIESHNFANGIRRAMRTRSRSVIAAS